MAADHVAGVEGGAKAILDGIARDGFYLTKGVVRNGPQRPERGEQPAGAVDRTSGGLELPPMT
jgi:hypothetical protein